MRTSSTLTPNPSYSTFHRGGEEETGGSRGDAKRGEDKDRERERKNEIKREERRRREK